jgi:hypothetical protein
MLLSLDPIYWDQFVLVLIIEFNDICPFKKKKKKKKKITHNNILYSTKLPFNVQIFLSNNNNNKIKGSQHLSHVSNN